jgi:hypothetical protein
MYTQRANQSPASRANLLDAVWFDEKEYSRLIETLVYRPIWIFASIISIQYQGGAASAAREQTLDE